MLMKFIICFPKILQLSSSTFFGRSSGSLRRPAVSGSRETFNLGNESDPTRSRTPEASPATVNKISSGQRTSPFGGSSDPKHTSGRNNSSIKNYDSTIKGIENLHFDDEERFHWMNTSRVKSSNLCDKDVRGGEIDTLGNSLMWFWNSRDKLLAFVLKRIDITWVGCRVGGVKFCPFELWCGSFYSMYPSYLWVSYLCLFLNVSCVKLASEMITGLLFTNTEHFQVWAIGFKFYTLHCNHVWEYLYLVATWPVFPASSFIYSNYWVVRLSFFFLHSLHLKYSTWYMLCLCYLSKSFCQSFEAPALSTSLCFVWLLHNTCVSPSHGISTSSV